MMVKLTGPGLARDATGSLAKELTFSNWKGKPYLKLHHEPSQPRTGPQVAMRAAMAALSAAWALATDPQHATWNDLAAQSVISPFNAFLAYNLTRWRDDQPPTRSYPATPTTLTHDASYLIPTVNGRTIRIDWKFWALDNAWFLLIYRHPTGAGTPIWNELIGMIYNPTPGENSFTDRTPTVGWNYYGISLCSTDGFLHPTHWKRNLVFP